MVFQGLIYAWQMDPYGLFSWPPSKRKGVTLEAGKPRKQTGFGEVVPRFVGQQRYNRNSIVRWSGSAEEGEPHDHFAPATRPGQRHGYFSFMADRP
jgi:hypothetical protein